MKYCMLIKLNNEDSVDQVIFMTIDWQAIDSPHLTITGTTNFVTKQHHRKVWCHVTTLS